MSDSVLSVRIRRQDSQGLEIVQESKSNIGEIKRWIIVTVSISSEGVKPRYTDEVTEQYQKQAWRWIDDGMYAAGQHFGTERYADDEERTDA
jgi:hypothetical protein